MLRKIVSLIAIFLICAIGVDATSIEKNPNKRKGAGAPFQIRREKKWGYMDKAGKVIIQQWSYIDRSGKTVLQLEKARWGFSDGLTIAGEYPDRVYVNKSGQVVAQYEAGSLYK